MSRRIKLLGDEEGFHITVDRDFNSEGFSIAIWKRNHGTAGFNIQEESKAVAMAEYLYENLLPEYEAQELRHKEWMKKFDEEQAKKPKPKPPHIPKNAPKIDVLICPQCDALIPPDEVSDERVYECSTCSTTGTGEDGRRCEQCNKFTAKISDTSCPECDGPMDDAEKTQAQRATNKELVRVAEAST